MALGFAPAVQVFFATPVLRSSCETEPLKQFDTQIAVPSKQMPNEPLPTGKVPSVSPVAALSFVRLWLRSFATQTFAPSKQRPYGPLPAGKVPRFLPVAASSSVTLLPP